MESFGSPSEGSGSPPNVPSEHERAAKLSALVNAVDPRDQIAGTVAGVEGRHGRREIARHDGYLASPSGLDLAEPNCRFEDHVCQPMPPIVAQRSSAFSGGERMLSPAPVSRVRPDLALRT